jgi:anti-sigma regulatory factor (Ser/Thr protein kinase)
MGTNSMSDGVSIRVAADVEQLATIRAFVERQADLLGVEASAIYDLVLAANEIATNIVVHGYQGRSGTIEVEMRRSGAAIEVRLRDQAPAFDPTRAPAPDLTLPLHKRPFGGMGIHVTRQMMDDIHHRALPQGGNELTLVKRGVVATSRKE